MINLLTRKIAQSLRYLNYLPLSSDLPWDWKTNVLCTCLALGET